VIHIIDGSHILVRSCLHNEIIVYFTMMKIVIFIVIVLHGSVVV